MYMNAIESTKLIRSSTHSEQWKLSGLICSWTAFTLRWHGSVIPITTSPGAYALQAHSAKSHPSAGAGAPFSITRAVTRPMRWHICMLNAACLCFCVGGCKHFGETFNLSRGIWEVLDTVCAKNLFLKECFVHHQICFQAFPSLTGASTRK